MTNERKKEYGGLILQPGCSNSCVFCGFQKNVPLSKIRSQVADSYKNLIDFKKQGIKNIVISGNDPLEYEDIIQIIEHIKKSGFQFIIIETNGLRLSDEHFLDEFIKSGINKLEIPLYGSNSKIHDSVTRTPGSFARTLKGIKGVLKKAPDIKIRISSLILQQNKNNLLDLIDLVKGELKIDSLNFSVPCILTYHCHHYYVPFKDLGPYVKKIYNYDLKMNYKISFTEIPYCVFGNIDRERINNTCLPPDLGKHSQPPKMLKSSIKDVPSYRLKRKIEMCKNCKASSFCDGFFINDIDRLFGKGNLKPLSK